jgi:hypothetical protein
MKGTGRGGEDWTDFPQREASGAKVMNVRSEVLAAATTRRIFYPEQDVSKLLRNTGKYLPDYTEPHPISSY